jgi:hypothetical protein
MNSFMKILLGNLLLNKGPQDFPCSQVLMRLCLIVYFISGIPGLMMSASFPQAIFAMTLDVVVLLAFVYLCLQAFSKSERFIQSVISLSSIGVVFQLIVLPLLFNFDADPEVAQQMLGLSLLLLMFVSWNLAVYAHIFRESFGIRLPVAMVLTVCYIVITLLARKIFFPELA